MLPNKPRGVPRVNDRRVLNGIFWVLQSGAPWRDLPTRLARTNPHAVSHSMVMIPAWTNPCCWVSRAQNGIMSSTSPGRMACTDAPIVAIACLAPKRVAASNHRSPVFATVYDFACTYGVPVFSADEYFQMLEAG
jgi:transposase